MSLAHDLGTVVRTQDIHISEDITFNTMLLSTDTLDGLKNTGFRKPSPIQLQGIPLGNCGFDLLLEAKSGTGKTAVFTVIALEQLDFQKSTQVIMLTPTREIAAQVSDVIKAIGFFHKINSGLTVEVVMGGLSIKDDKQKFAKKRKVHIIVGSPGRLRHLIQDKYIDTSSVRLLVLDEADKLMEKTFQADINYIFTSLPKRKQVIMSSATYPEDLKQFISNYMNKPQHVCPDTTSVLLGISQKITTVVKHENISKQTQDRYKELKKILTTLQFKQCLIFCNYQVRVVDLCKMLVKDKWPAEHLYGKQEQTDRLEALKTLQEFKCRILVSTDLAARGIDASNVDLVINFEPPYEWTTYLHRIGRAGRYGSYGTAITILSTGKEEIEFKDMLKLLKSHLDIRNLWTDAKIDLENTKCSNEDKLSVEISPEKSVVNEIDVEKANEEIWRGLYSNVSQPKEISIEDFKGLNSSFENFSAVESFNDLMSSFNDAQDTTESVKYNSLNINKNLSNYVKSLDKVLEVNTEKEMLDKDKSFDINDSKTRVNCLKQSESNLSSSKNQNGSSTEAENIQNVDESKSKKYSSTSGTSQEVSQKTNKGSENTDPFDENTTSHKEKTLQDSKPNGFNQRILKEFNNKCNKNLSKVILSNGCYGLENTSKIDRKSMNSTTKGELASTSSSSTSVHVPKKNIKSRNNSFNARHELDEPSNTHNNQPRIPYSHSKNQKSPSNGIGKLQNGKSNKHNGAIRKLSESNAQNNVSDYDERYHYYNHDYCSESDNSGSDSDESSSDDESKLGSDEKIHRISVNARVPNVNGIQNCRSKSYKLYNKECQKYFKQISSNVKSQVQREQNNLYNSYLNYQLWYNQMKMISKQIEMMTYIEEMSKL